MPSNISDLLRQTYVFARLGIEQQAILARAFSEHRFHPGEIVVRRGEPADGWRIVENGKARVVDRAPEAPSIPAVLGPPDTFGDRSLIEPTVWPFTIRAESSITIYTLSSSAFREFVRQGGPTLESELAERVSQNAEFEFLKRLRPFAHLAPDRVETLLHSLTRQAFPQGAHVFREDDPSDCCYVVRHGRVHLLKAVRQSQKQLAVRREGDLIGETELLYGTPRIADALASTDIELLVFSRELFDQFLPEGPEREAIFQVATERLLQYQNMLSEADPQAERLGVPDLTVHHVRPPGQTRSFPLVSSASEHVGGVACLAMIDAFHRRESRWQERLETFIWERRPQTLVSFSRIAEECGYFARLTTPPGTDLRVADLPAVIEDDDRSLAVLFEAESGGVTIGNPARGMRTEDLGRFREWWNGQLLTIATPLPSSQALPIRGYVRSLISIVLASVLVVAFGLAGPLASKAIIDRVLVNGDVSLLRLLVVAMAAVIGFQLLATILRDYLVAHAERRATFSLQQRFLNHVLHLPQRTIISKPMSSLAVSFHDNEALVSLSSDAGLTIVVDGVALLVYFAALWLLSPPALVIAGVFVAAYVGVSVVMSTVARDMNRRGHDARAALQAHLLETVSGIQTLKSLLVETIFFERGRKLMNHLKAAEFAASRVAFTTELIGSALHIAAIVAILGYGTRLASSGRATTGDMVASLGIFGATLAPLSGLLDMRNSIRGVRSAMASLEHVSSLETEGGSAGGVPPPIEGHITFSHVSFRYPGQSDDVLSDINLEVLPGQTVAVVGRSGSGKTTLMNLLMGLYAPSSGNIYIDHIDIQSIPRVAFRRQLGVVEQQPFLFDGTIRENIAKSDPAIPFDRVVAAAGVAGIHEFIATLPSGYDTRIGERGAALSGGEKQRLMIARALVAMPRLLILDEATSAVDSGSESVIQQNIRRATEGRTTFVIAHRLSTIRHADRIVVLDRGRIVESGTHAELLAARRLYYYLSTRTV